MKNKIITSLIALSMVMSLTACNTDKAENSADSNTTTANSAVSEDTKQETSETEQTENNIPEDFVTEDLCMSESWKTHSMNEPWPKVVYSRPADYWHTEENVIEQIYVDDISLVAVCGSNNEHVDNLIDIVDIYRAFGESVGSACKGYIRRSHIEVISHEPAMVNGWKAEKFIGKIPNVTHEKTWDCHISGYVLEIEDAQIMIVSLVSDMAQDPEVIAKSDALMEKIAGTIRLSE